MTTFEVYRFSLWFYKNSIRWSLPKKCITSLLILTFLKFNEKRNIIHAHWNLISQFVPYEKSVRRCPSLKILQDAPKTDRATFKFLKSMCFIKCEKWSLVCSENGDVQKHLKKSLYQWQLLKSIVSVFGFIKIQYGDRYQNLQGCAL